MKKTHLDALEKALGLKLPASYRGFMESITYDDKTLLWGEPTEVVKGRKTELIAHLPVRIELFNDVDMLVERNQEVRRQGQAFAEGWPNTHLAIGDDGCGNIYCIDVTDARSPALLMFDHDEDDFVEAYPSLTQLFELMKKSEPETIPEAAGLTVTRAAAGETSVQKPISLAERSRTLPPTPRSSCLITFRESIRSPERA